MRKHLLAALGLAAVMALSAAPGVRESSDTSKQRNARKGETSPEARRRGRRHNQDYWWGGRATIGTRSCRTTITIPSQREV